MNTGPYSFTKSKVQLETVVDELSRLFPDLDLRFNIMEDSSALRCIAAEYPRNAFDILLGWRSVDVIVQEAALKIRKIAGLLDA